jgi:hypothetical protein
VRSYAEPVDNCLASIPSANVLNILGVSHIIKPDLGISAGEQQTLESTHKKSS